MKALLRFGMVLLVIVSVGWAGTVVAQSYPTKPIRLIVGFAPGGSTDIVARLVGEKLSKSLGQPIVIENRPGAGSNIAAEIVAKSAPDGYTMFVFTPSNTAAYSLYKLAYDPIKDFEHITQLTSVASILVVSPSLGVKSVKELIALAKSKPGQLNYASAGVGTSPHMAGELFKAMTGVDIVHIPYKGTGPALIDLISGRVNMTFEGATAVLPHVKSGKLIALASNGAKRAPMFPDLPTVSEAGVPGFEIYSWHGLGVPEGTPKEIVTLVNKEVIKVLQIPEVKEKLLTMGTETIGSTPEQFAAFMKAEIAKMAKIIKEANIRID